ncbi:hypothetical protein EK21DRAFT_118638 [Setomelanomma holmii]|uniref:Uncharacterized protein n=1 Tax=Setomelanomma holmii TaxID=210430 RepID=A0A9P4LFU7_9PLEO|nr:hypothetical protein EK21DRAFT_118638 [Setomelanomma holmii]
MFRTAGAAMPPSPDNNFLLVRRTDFLSILDGLSNLQVRVEEPMWREPRVRITDTVNALSRHATRQPPDVMGVFAAPPPGYSSMPREATYEMDYRPRSLRAYCMATSPRMDDLDGGPPIFIMATPSSGDEAVLDSPRVSGSCHYGHGYSRSASPVEVRYRGGMGYPSKPLSKGKHGTPNVTRAPPQQQDIRGEWGRMPPLQGGDPINIEDIEGANRQESDGQERA